MKNIEDKINKIIDLINDGIDYDIEVEQYNARVIGLKKEEEVRYHLRKILTGE